MAKIDHGCCSWYIVAQKDIKYIFDIPEIICVVRSWIFHTVRPFSGRLSLNDWFAHSSNTCIFEEFSKLHLIWHADIERAWPHNNCFSFVPNILKLYSNNSSLRYKSVYGDKRSHIELWGHPYFIFGGVYLVHYSACLWGPLHSMGDLASMEVQSPLTVFLLGCSIFR